MQDTQYKGVNTQLRIYETKLLTREDFEKMLRAEDLAEALDVLKSTDYPVDVTEAIEHKNFDKFLLSHLKDMYNELYQVTPDSEVIQIHTLRYSYHNLKVLLKQRFTGMDLEHLLIPIGKYPVTTLRNLVNTEQSEKLNPIMVEGVTEAIADYETYKRVEAADVFMDTYYYKHMRTITDRLNDPTITKMADAIIDLDNLSTVVRSINQKKSRSFLHTVLSSSGSISKHAIIEAAQEGSIAVLNQLYMEKPYAKKLEDIMVSSKNDIDPMVLDKVIDEIVHDLMDEAKLQAFGPMPVMAYMFALEKEITNIRLILVGKDNKIDNAIIRERMRPIYES
ncbi:V/A-type H+-transporting ATPase subunit C [Pelagirhabdus alkalitolerans]|uniref:V/A-type H+-transporting ATPase subunit C n=1 Tax=Pelagirhabdus alkalitolerans TaxID=1612202 RepID=A0A1G6H784_9BACI|nr:V-type ATPase subunit [Pelagirhabdus alkalitolerans]SDB90130.1 V/A-type H+-transporting ATPase subunit C [Pelagirhabdus alkalitolerans]